MIYFIQMGNVGPIKIGFTSSESIFSRLDALQTANPYPLVVLLTIDGDTSLEKAIQLMFIKYRIRGEWFNPDPELIAYINMLRHEKEFPTEPKGPLSQEII